MAQSVAPQSEYVDNANTQRKCMVLVCLSFVVHFLTWLMHFRAEFAKYTGWDGGVFALTRLGRLF